jgi:hypothetical protein
MYMQESKYPQEDFLAFKARFIANALEGGIAESEWFTALWVKIIPRIRLQNLSVRGNWNKDFLRMAEYLVYIETERADPENRPPCAPIARKASALTKKSTYTTNTKTSSSALVPYRPQARLGSLQPTRNTSRQPTSATEPNRTTFDRTSGPQASDQAKCYRYGQLGHFQSKCPNPASINEVDEDSLEGQEEDDNDTTEVEEETDENREGNGEA